MNFINEINDILWTYILIIMLLGCAVWFSIRTRFVQFRRFSLPPLSDYTDFPIRCYLATMEREIHLPYRHALSRTYQLLGSGRRRNAVPRLQSKRFLLLRQYTQPDIRPAAFGLFRLREVVCADRLRAQRGRGRYVRLRAYLERFQLEHQLHHFQQPEHTDRIGKKLCASRNRRNHQ